MMTRAATYYLLSVLVGVAFGASYAQSSPSGILKLRSDSSQTESRDAAAFTWMLSENGEDAARLGPVTVTCDPSYRTVPSTGETSCAGVDFFVRMTAGLEEHIKVIIVRDDDSGRYATATNAAALQTETDSGHTVQKLCGDWTLDECFVNREMTYTSSWKDLGDTFTPVTHAWNPPNSTVSRYGSTAGVIVTQDARGVQYNSRIAGVMYNVHLNSRQFYIQLEGWTPEVASRMAQHSFIQFEVRFNGSNSLRTGIFGFGVSLALTLAVGLSLFCVRKAGIRKYGVLDPLRPAQVWNVRSQDSAGVPIPLIQLPEIVGQPVTPARLQRLQKSKDTQTPKSHDDAADEPAPSLRDRLYRFLGAPAPTKFTRAPDDEVPETIVATSPEAEVPSAESREDDRTVTEMEPLAAGAPQLLTLPQPAASAAVLTDDDPDELICRICQDGSPKNDLFAPCHCSGTSKYVHKQCLDHWRHATANPLHRTVCAECKAAYVEKAPDRPTAATFFTPLVRYCKMATALSAALLIGGYDVKWLAFLMTGDSGINWWPDQYHVFLGAMFITSELMTVSCCSHFFTGYPISVTRAVLWTAGWILPAGFGYVAQFFIWMTEVVVWTPEISYGSGVAALFVVSQYFLPTLNEYVQRAEMAFLLEREAATRMQHAETLVALAAAAAAARAQRAANARGDEALTPEHHQDDTTSEEDQEDEVAIPAEPEPPRAAVAEEPAAVAEEPAAVAEENPSA